MLKNTKNFIYLFSLLLLALGLGLFYLGCLSSEKGTIWLQSGEAASTLSLETFTLTLSDNDKNFESYNIRSNDAGEIANIDEINRQVHAPFNIAGLEGIGGNKAAKSDSHKSSAGAGHESLKMKATKVMLNLKSPMFDENFSLESPGSEEKQLGPVSFRFTPASNNASDSETQKTSVTDPKKEGNKKEEISAPALWVSDAASNTLIRKIPLEEILRKDMEINGVNIKLVRVYEQATVVDNKLSEGGEKGGNPALELSIAKGTETPKRDVIYALHEEFSLNPDGVHGLKFSYRVPASAKTHAGDSESAGAPVAREIPMGDFVDLSLGTDKSVLVTLYKNKEQVGQQKLVVGENMMTPWMGMGITLKDLVQEGDEGGGNSTNPHLGMVSKREPVLFLNSTRLDAQGQKVPLKLNQSLNVKVDDKTYELSFIDDVRSLPVAVRMDDQGKISVIKGSSVIDLGSTVGKAICVDGWEFKLAAHDPFSAVIKAEKNISWWLYGSGILLCLLGILAAFFTCKKLPLARS